MTKQLAIFVVMAGLALSCGRCGNALKSGGQGDVARWFPKDVRTAVLVPSLEPIGEAVKVVESMKAASLASSLRGFDNAKGWSDALVAELGFDIRDPKAVEEAGIDSKRGLGAALLANRATVAVVAVNDADKFYRFVRKQMVARFRSELHNETKVEGRTLHTFGLKGGPQQAQLLLHDGWGFVTLDSDSSNVLALSKLASTESLQAVSAFQASLKRLPKGEQLIVYVPQASTWRELVPFSNVAVGFSLTREGVSLSSDAMWLGDASLLEWLKRKAAAKAMASIPADAFLMASFGGEVSGLKSVSEMLVGPRVRAAFAEAGLDFKKEVLDNAAPGFWLALSLAPKPKLADGMPSLNVRDTNPFEYVHLSGVAQAKDGAALQTTLNKVSGLGPQIGAQITKREHKGGAYYFTSYQQGEGVHFAAREQQFFFGSPSPRLEALLDGTRVEGEALDASSRKLFDERGVAVVLDVKRLTTHIRQLPNEAWGIGGFRIRQTTERWLDAISDIGAMQLAFDSQEGAIQAQFKVRFVPAGAAK